MPKPSQHALIWSEEHQHYELHSPGQVEQCFRRGDEPAFSRWLAQHTAFTFQGQAGRLSVLKEARSRGTGYWYAYRTQNRQTHKRYLGSSASVKFARLEQVAKGLGSELSPLAPPQTLQETRASSARREETEREEVRPTAKPWAEQGVALLSSKLSRPRLPLSLVERSRLFTELDMVLSHQLTLVSASAGSGKTTLLSAWAAGASSQRIVRNRAAGPEPVLAWLSLDALDNNPIRFWASVIAALRTCEPRIGQGTLAILHSPQSPPLSTILTNLLNEIGQVGRDIILILDDYHVIEDQTIHEAMLFLLDHLPDTLHLVLATRTDPELPLSRLRVRSQLIEIRDNDLRFLREETASFLLEGMGLPLSEEEVVTLQTRTEGWIAGLQLAALSLRKCEDISAWISDFAGSHRYLLDYVQQEILAQLPLPLQNFLLQTSILARMNAALCQAVTAAADGSASQQMLEALERANLFVVPLDEQRQWYRFHDLFREVLLTRLHASQPQLVPLLHIRAASFYETAGELQEAIAHALAAPDYLLAASLIEQAASPFWLRGEVRTVYTWVFSLPDTVLCAHIRLALGAALRFVNSVNLSNETLYVSMAAQMELTFARMEGILRRKKELSLSDAEVTLIGRRLHLLHALIEARAILKRGDTERLRLLSQETEELPQDEEVSWNMIPLSLTFWLAVMLLGEGASLVSRLRSAKQLMMEAGDHLVTIRVMTWLARAYTQAAQLRLAQQEALSALALVEQSGVHTPWEGYLYYSQLIVSYARNRLEEASDWLHRLLRSAQDWQQVELLVMGEIFSARLGLARGDLSTAQQALHKLEALIEQEGYANHAPWVSTLRVQLWLAEANLAQASEWAAQTTFSPDTWNPLRRWELLMLVRVSLAQQQYAQAAETLSSFSQYFDRPADIQTEIEWMALYVVALYQSGKSEQAVRVAARLLAMTGPEDYARLYLDVGEPMMKQVLLILLQAAGSEAACPLEGEEAPQDDDPSTAAVSISRSSISRLLAAFEQSSALEASASRASTQEIQPEPTAAEVQRQPAEPLSLQEQRVLRLLVAGQTYAEMAEALIVSPNTIKTQVSSIYRKLGVSRRAEAIAVTARFHLL